MLVEINRNTPMCRISATEYALVVPCMDAEITVRGKATRRGIRTIMTMTATVSNGLSSSDHELGVGDKAWGNLQKLAYLHGITLWGTWQALRSVVASCEERNESARIMQILDTNCPA